MIVLFIILYIIIGFIISSFVIKYSGEKDSKEDYTGIFILALAFWPGVLLILFLIGLYKLSKIIFKY